MAKPLVDVLTDRPASRFFYYEHVREADCWVVYRDVSGCPRMVYCRCNEQALAREIAYALNAACEPNGAVRVPVDFDA